MVNNMTNSDLREVMEIIDKKVNQVIALANHIKGGNVDWNYVQEKRESYPVLDKANNVVRKKIAAILKEAYGVDISDL